MEGFYGGEKRLEYAEFEWWRRAVAWKKCIGRWSVYFKNEKAGSRYPNWLRCFVWLRKSSPDPMASIHKKFVRLRGVHFGADTRFLFQEGEPKQVVGFCGWTRDFHVRAEI